MGKLNNATRAFSNRNRISFNGVDSNETLPRTLSDEHKQKLSDSMKNRPFSDEHKAKLKVAARKRCDRVNEALAVMAAMK